MFNIINKNKWSLSIILSLVVIIFVIPNVFAIEDEEDLLLIPQNGIPLVIIRVDESDEAINNAIQEDPEHEYGTIAEMNASRHHTTRCVGTAEIILPEGYEGDYDLTNNPSGEVELQYIRGRGNSTWMLSDKKPYKIKYDKKQDVLGMGSNKEWGLLANSYDQTLAHNDIVSWLSEQMEMEYTTQMVPVDLVMIGSNSGANFLGNYYLTELVDIGKNRVDIKELDEDDVENITGGYLLSIYYDDQDFKEPENTVFETEYSKIKFINENPYFDSGDLTEGQEAQRTYIREYINQIDDLIMNNEVITEDIHNQIAELLDLKSTADFWLIQEFTINYDAFKTSSNYLYKKRDGKLYWGPLWDFDLMFYMIYADDLEHSQGFNRSLPFAWFDRLRNNDPLFVEIIKDEWEIMNEKIITLTKTNGVLDEYKQTLRDSWNENYELYKDITPYFGNDTSIDEEFENLRAIIEYRRKWFNDNIDDIGRTYFKLTFKVDDEVVKEEMVRGNSWIEIPDDINPQKDGYLFKEWIEEETNENINSVVILSDVTFVPSFIKTSDIKENIAMYFGTYEDWVPLEYETYNINSIVFYPGEQDEALRNSITWTSSNEEVATIDGNGEVSLLAVGDTTITGTIFNGISKSYLLHIYDENSMPEFVDNPTELKVEKDKFTIEVGESAQILWKLTPNPVNPDIYIYVSSEVSEEGIIEIDNTCLCFVGLKAGKVKVKITMTNTDDDNHATFTKEIDVNVRAKKIFDLSSHGKSSISSKKSKETIWSKVDDWAKEEMENAEELDLIPETFKGKDFTESISRSDFTAVAVKLYEALIGKETKKIANNPFIDTNDDYVLKAYTLGITKGISDTEFGNGTITREQMATMIDRAISKAGINITVDLEIVTRFDDDGEMHEWGRPSIYAMTKEEIINGIGDNKYNPLGAAKIEEALAIALRCVEAYKNCYNQ